MQHLWLIPALPLLGFLINGLVGRRLPKTVIHAIAVGTRPDGTPILALVGSLVIVAVAQTGSLFSSDAWNNVAFAATEVKNPRRNLPLALGLVLVGVTAALVLNRAFVGKSVAKLMLLLPLVAAALGLHGDARLYTERQLEICRAIGFRAGECNATGNLAGALMDLGEIGEALERMEHGTFGQCVECSEPISKPRLQAIPYARHCIRCARKLEGGE